MTLAYIVLATFVGGNLGRPLVEVVGTPAAGPDGVVVVELSSFQLERVAHLRNHIALLLNVTDDHLDRYVGLDDYAATKALQSSEARAVSAGRGQRGKSTLNDGSVARIGSDTKIKIPSAFGQTLRTLEVAGAASFEVAAGQPFVPDVDLHMIAVRTPGFTGADLAIDLGLSAGK